MRCAFEDFESGTAFHVEDGEVHTWRSLADHVAHALGKRPFAFRIPKSALCAAGAASEVVARVRDQAVVLTRDKWRDGKQKDWLMTSETTQTILGWRPTVTFAEGARVTGAWYRARGWI